MNFAVTDSGEAVRLARQVPDPLGSYLVTVFERHASVPAWSDEHEQGYAHCDPAHDINDPEVAQRCLLECVAPHPVCDQCSYGTRWPCPDAVHALRLLSAAL